MIMCQATPDSATTSGEMNSSKLAQYEINLSFCGLVGMLDLPRIEMILAGDNFTSIMATVE